MAVKGQGGSKAPYTQPTRVTSGKSSRPGNPGSHATDPLTKSAGVGGTGTTASRPKPFR